MSSASSVLSKPRPSVQSCKLSELNDEKLSLLLWVWFVLGVLETCNEDRAWIIPKDSETTFCWVKFNENEVEGSEGDEEGVSELSLKWSSPKSQWRRIALRSLQFWFGSVREIQAKLGFPATGFRRCVAGFYKLPWLRLFSSLKIKPQFSENSKERKERDRPFWWLKEDREKIERAWE